MSGKTDVGSRMKYRDYMIRMDTPLGEVVVEEANYRKIKAVRNILDRLCNKL